MKENINAIWIVLAVLAVTLFVNFYMTCELFHEFNQHVQEEEVIEHPSLEEMLGNRHQLYITIQTEQHYDTCTVPQGK